MIKYKLNCKKCNYSFDSWFSNSNEFERIKKLKLLNCSSCNSKKIEKSLMAPSVINNKNRDAIKNTKKFTKIKKKLRNIKILSKTILNLLVIIFHIRQDLYTMIIKKI